MLIDFHTHAFPDALAGKAIPRLAAVGGIRPEGGGTVSDLIRHMDECGSDVSVVLNIATNPRQQHNVNSFAIETNAHPRLRALGSLNPDSDCISAEARRLADAGIRGVKIHPDYMGAYVDDEKFDAVYRAALENDLFVVSHSGWDFASPDCPHCTPERILRVLKRFPGLRFVAAHMGANRFWDDAERLLIGKDLWIDTSLAVMFHLDPKQGERMLTGHDPDKILFGSDFPWARPDVTRDYLNALSIPETLRRKIFSENALALLGEKPTGGKESMT